MNDYERIILTALIAFGFGIGSGVLLENWRERRSFRKSILADYMKRAESKETPDDIFILVGIFQRVGGWRLNDREISQIRNDILGRGLIDPFLPWEPVFKDMKTQASGFLRWAKESNVDFMNPDATIKALAAHADMRNIPLPPSKGGAVLI